MKILVVCTLFVTLISYSYPQCITPNDHEHHPNAHRILYSGQQEFSLALLKAINEVGPTENIFFSPYSTFHALLLAYFISGTETEKYLKTALRLDSSQNKSSIFGAYKYDKLATTLNTKNSTYEFTNANRIYVANQIEIRSCVQPLLHDVLQISNFQRNPEVIRNEINKWVENNTHDMIKNLLPSGTIDASTNLVLVNAAYFKGVWENKFDPEDTRPEAFFISPSTNPIMVDMMHLETTLNYDVSETLQAHVLELPYQGDDISMFILLPPFSKTANIETVLENLNVENFHSMVNGSISPRQVQLSLPKFTLEHTIELTPILEHLGVGNLFSHDADFYGLTGRHTHELSVGAGIHKAKIELNEEGTKAAAATSLFTWRMLQDEKDMPVEFKCDRPFAFVMYNKVLNRIGVGNLFTDSSDLTVLAPKNDAKLGRALHKARIEVSEEGTKAAAATVLFTFRSSRPAEPAQFKCNHPFVYVIYHKPSSSILFTGVFRRPS